MTLAKSRRCILVDVLWAYYGPRTLENVGLQAQPPRLADGAWGDELVPVNRLDNHLRVDNLLSLDLRCAK
jgi:hypothetical protein